MMSETDRAAERWLRAKGLPYFVPRRAWADGLLTRIAPFLAFVFYVDVAFSGILRFTVTVDAASATEAVLLIVLAVAIALLLIALPFAVATLVGMLIRRRPSAALPVTVLLLALCLVAAPLLALVVGTADDAPGYLLANIGLVLLGYLLTWLGVGSLLSWATRTALRQIAAIGALATRALPILMLVVVFAFFSRPLWEVTSTMEPGRLLAVVAFFVVLGVLFVIPITRTEMKELDQRIDPVERVALVRSTGLPGLEARASAPGPQPGRFERFNLETVFVLSLGLQAAIFGVLVCAFLLVLGSLAFSEEVLEEWVGARETTIDLFGVALPFTWALLKTAVFLSCVSSLNFLVSVTTNHAYRSAFYEPQFVQARTALAVRAAYLQGGTDAAPPAGQDTPAPASPPPPTTSSATAPPPEPEPDADPHSHGNRPGMIEPGMIEPGRGSE